MFYMASKKRKHEQNLLWNQETDVTKYQNVNYFTGFTSTNTHNGSLMFIALSTQGRFKVVQFLLKTVQRLPLNSTDRHLLH